MNLTEFYNKIGLDAKEAVKQTFGSTQIDILVAGEDYMLLFKDHKQQIMYLTVAPSEILFHKMFEKSVHLKNVDPTASAFDKFKKKFPRKDKTNGA